MLKVASSNPDHGEVCSIQRYVIKFVSDLRQVGDFLWVSLTHVTEILLKVKLNAITLTITLNTWSSMFNASPAMLRAPHPPRQIKWSCHLIWATKFLQPHKKNPSIRRLHPDVFNTTTVVAGNKLYTTCAGTYSAIKVIAMAASSTANKSEGLLFNANSAIFQIYHGENK